MRPFSPCYVVTDIHNFKGNEMDRVLTFIIDLFSTVAGSLAHNWIPLLVAVFLAAAMKTYINTEKLKNALLKRTRVSIYASVAFGAFTPLCACGTTAVIIGMLSSTLPWGPVMAFLTSSPLMSPSGFVMLAGVIDVEFAVALTLASIILGVGSGYIAHLVDKTGYLAGQTRLSVDSGSCAGACGADDENESCELAGEIESSEGGALLCCASAAAGSNLSATPAVRVISAPWPKVIEKLRVRDFLRTVVEIGLKRIVLFYSIFVAVGYVVNMVVPERLIMSLFGAESPLSVALAALIGLPLYISGESAIPLIESLMQAGAGRGAMLAFLITGPGTSAWVIAGITSFLKSRALALYVGLIFVGGVLLGYLYELVRMVTM